jgi:prepilin peptidase CpaA
MDPLRAATLSSFLALAIARDLAERRIPNRLVGVYAIVALVLGTAGPPGPVAAVGGLATGLGLLLLPFAVGAVGAGDVKFFAVVGAFLGPARTLDALLLGMVLGGLFCIPILVRRHWGDPSARSATVPYAVPLALGTLAAIGCEFAHIPVL